MLDLQCGILQLLSPMLLGKFYFEYILKEDLDLECWYIFNKHDRVWNGIKDISVACSFQFSWADEALEASSPGTPGQENNGE